MVEMLMYIVNILSVCCAVAGACYICAQEKARSLSLKLIAAGIAGHAFVILLNGAFGKCAVQGAAGLFEFVLRADHCLYANGYWKTTVSIWLLQAMLLAGMFALLSIYVVSRNKKIQ